MKRSFVLALVAVLALTGCARAADTLINAEEPEVVAQVDPSPTKPPEPTDPPAPTPTAVPSSETPTVTLTPDLPTLTPLPTATPLPTNTPIPPQPTSTPVPPQPTNTPQPTATTEADPTATAGAEPTATTEADPTATDQPDPTATPPESTAAPGENLFRNPGFEGPTSPIGFTEINVVAEWGAFYCDDPYVPGGCPAPQPCEDGTASGCNEEGLMMGRPEFKRAVEPNRHRSGEGAQQWFCYYRTCKAGVYQTIPTTPGQTCTVSAWVQTWSNWEGGPETPSDGLDTLDGQANSTWRIKVDPGGDDYAFGPNLITSRDFTFADGHYDNWLQISYTFTAVTNSATIFFENGRLWPIENNDSFVDDAYATCQ